MEEILSFFNQLQNNNNREWFSAHKDTYLKAKDSYENFCDRLILGLSEFDEDIKLVSRNECVFRIYRDIRFASDKSPYKTHFGAYIAYPNGRKSHRGGYYFHVQPGNQSFFCTGIWCPEPAILKKLRQSFFDNYDEYIEITGNADFKQVYGDSIYREERLKKLPAGFPKDFIDPELLKLKHYIVTHPLSDSDLLDPLLLEKLLNYARIGHPLLCFINYTIDEETY